MTRLTVQHRFFLGQGIAAAVVVGAIVALTIRSWWIVQGAVVVLVAATAAVVALTLDMIASRERPSPSTAAALYAEGVADPDAHFSDLVAELTEERVSGGRPS
jgi:hypothetical protein